MDLLVPAEQHYRPRIPAPGTPAPAMAGRAGARAWLDAHRATLVAVVVHAAACGWPGHATRLAATLYRYLETGGHYADAVTIHSNAHRAACSAGDRAAKATALTNLGIVRWRQGKYEQAAGCHRRALAASREIGDRTGEAEALNGVGEIMLATGQAEEACVQHAAALSLASQIGDRYERARAHNGLAAAHHITGDAGLARYHRRRAQDLYTGLGAPSCGEMRTRLAALDQRDRGDRGDLVTL
jgi:tetratricopeptide (TPR) repeat protein